MKSKYLHITSLLNEITELPKQLLGDSKVIGVQPFGEIVEDYLGRCLEKLNSLTGKINFRSFESLFIKKEASSGCLNNLVKNWIEERVKDK